MSKQKEMQVQNKFGPIVPWNLTEKDHNVFKSWLDFRLLLTTDALQLIMIRLRDSLFQILVQIAHWIIGKNLKLS